MSRVYQGELTISSSVQTLISRNLSHLILYVLRALILANADDTVHVPHSPITYHADPSLQTLLCTSRSTTSASQGQTPHSPERLVPKDQGTYRFAAQGQRITRESSSCQRAYLSSSLSIYGMATSTRGSSTRTITRSVKRMTMPSFTISASPLLQVNESSVRSRPMDQSLFPYSPTRRQSRVDIQPKIVRYSHSSSHCPNPRRPIVRPYARLS